MPEVFVTLPTILTDSALRVPEPPTLSALALPELSYRLQPVSSTAAVPCSVVAPLADGSSEMTQPLPPIPTATARALMLSGLVSNRTENRRLCGSVTVTSTAFWSAAYGPDAGGR